MGAVRRRAMVTVCAVASLAATTSLGTATAASPGGQPTPQRAAHHQAQDPVLVDCQERPVVRPADFLLACGDGNSRLTSLEWKSWDATAAVARGVNVVNDCKPYCAAGTFRSYAVVVRLDDARSWEEQPDLRQYTRMTLTYTGDRPEGSARAVTYPLWG
ncbi:hypothetical protein [Streptomyces cyaneogriseus]|uniref:hypothetical protein n=1 Tax=Streptomyces cyaneogriseus TaxID=68192 RepID=UPI00099D4C32|nr:hypothetical protein [Streptomyces cyaneogriseus]